MEADRKRFTNRSVTGKVRYDGVSNHRLAAGASAIVRLGAPGDTASLAQGCRSRAVGVHLTNLAAVRRSDDYELAERLATFAAASLSGRLPFAELAARIDAAIHELGRRSSGVRGAEETPGSADRPSAILSSQLLRQDHYGLAAHDQA